MNPDLISIYQQNPRICDELERRDSAFRFSLDDDQRRSKDPWIMLGREGLAEEDAEIWLRLANKELTPDEALDAMTKLMEQYYGSPYRR